MRTETQNSNNLHPLATRTEMLERMSVNTMRYVRSTPTSEAEGLVRRVYEMVENEFFITGSITSQSAAPEIMAGMWTALREVILVTDKLDRGIKEVMGAKLSQINRCACCTDMLVDLIHANGEHETASGILAGEDERITDLVMRERCIWIKAIADAKTCRFHKTPFTAEELPEAIGSLMVFSYVIRFSNVVMNGSPVSVPFGISA